MNNDEKVLDIIRQLIKEVKQEVKTKKVLAESKSPEQIFSNHRKNERVYVTKIVLEALEKAQK